MHKHFIVVPINCPYCLLNTFSWDVEWKNIFLFWINFFTFCCHRLGKIKQVKIILFLTQNKHPQVILFLFSSPIGVHHSLEPETLGVAHSSGCNLSYRDACIHLGKLILTCYHTGAVILYSHLLNNFSFSLYKNDHKVLVYYK